MQFLGVLYFLIGILWKYLVEADNNVSHDDSNPDTLNTDSLIKYLLSILSVIGILISYYSYLQAKTYTNKLYWHERNWRTKKLIEKMKNQ